MSKEKIQVGDIKEDELLFAYRDKDGILHEKKMNKVVRNNPCNIASVFTSVATEFIKIIYKYNEKS